MSLKVYFDSSASISVVKTEDKEKGDRKIEISWVAWLGFPAFWPHVFLGGGNLKKMPKEKQKCGIGVEEWDNWVIFFKSRCVWRRRSSRGIHTLWRRLRGSREGHTPDPTTPGHGLLRNTPGGCRSLPVKDNGRSVSWCAYRCLLSFATILTLHASLPPSIYPAHTILRVIMPG